MVAFRMHELGIIDVVSIAACHGEQVEGWPAVVSQDGSLSDDRVSPGRRALHILIADGERNSAEAFARLVRHEGHVAHAVSDGFAALRAAAIQHPDVVLLDMDVPLMGGIQVAEYLRRDFPSKKCFLIAVTERADDARRQQCFDAGIDLVLAKPVDLEIIQMLLMLECARVNRRRTHCTCC